MTLNKPHLFLDLDETLFHSKTSDNNTFLVSPRPFLDEFLKFAFENFRVSVWTASTTPYAVEVVKKYVLNGRPDRKLVYLLTRFNCDECIKKYGGDIKNMQYVIDASRNSEDSNLVVTKDNLIMIDDNVDVQNAQRRIGVDIINIPEFDNEHNPALVQTDRCLLDCIYILNNFLKKNFLEKSSQKPLLD
jgi:hypothetical protein